MPVQRPYNPNAKRMAEMMQADLAKVGINAKLVSYEWGEYRKRMQAGEHQMGFLGWTGDNGDPDNFFFLAGATRTGSPRPEHPEMVQRQFKDDMMKARTLRNRRIAKHLQGNAEDPPRRYAMAEHRPLDRVRARPQGGLGLQDKPARRP